MPPPRIGMVPEHGVLTMPGAAQGEEVSEGRMARSSRIQRVESGSSFHGATDWIMAALLIGAAVASVAYPVLYLHMRFVFDPNDPDFNPAVLVPVFLSVFGLKYRFEKSIRRSKAMKAASGAIAERVSLGYL